MLNIISTVIVLAVALCGVYIFGSIAIEIAEEK